MIVLSWPSSIFELGSYILPHLNRLLLQNFGKWMIKKRIFKTHFDAWYCYFFGSSISLVLVVKVLLINMFIFVFIWHFFRVISPKKCSQKEVVWKKYKKHYSTLLLGHLRTKFLNVGCSDYLNIFHKIYSWNRSFNY